MTLASPTIKSNQNQRNLRTDDLTVCFSVIPADKICIEENWRLMNRLNNGQEWRWIVGVDHEESPTGEEIKQLGDNRCQLIDVAGEDVRQASLRSSGYHFGAALNKLMCRINSRFLLVQDPDFYLVYPEWATEMVTHMKKNNLAFLGVPWHPKWYMKYRYFPCAHCMFIDLDKISVDSLNFLPDVPMPSQEAGPWLGLKRKMLRQLPSVVRSCKDYWYWTVPNRSTICKEWDVSGRLFLQYGHIREIQSECAIPVFRPNLDFIGPRGAFLQFTKLVEKFLPDHLSYFPKNQQSFTSRGFQQAGYPDVSHKAWEEFMWQGRPFGFHIRRHPKRFENYAEDIRQLPKLLDSFVELTMAKN